MRVKWAEGTPERACVEVRIRLIQALRPTLGWLDGNESAWFAGGFLVALTAGWVWLGWLR